MEYVSVQNKRTGATVAERVAVATCFWSRLKGLLGRARLLPEEGLIIRRCNGVHMFFMTFAIDVVFCSVEDRVLAIERNLRPWRVSAIVPAASYVIELASGTAERVGLELGDILKIERSK